jgi:hypothetical protein
MEALCEDRDPGTAYFHSNATEEDGLGMPDWKDVGFDWSNSMSLNTGIMDANASISRLLTQFNFDKNPDGNWDLDATLPSVAEALAVLSGGSLLMSAVDAPFVNFWVSNNVMSLMNFFNAIIELHRSNHRETSRPIFQRHCICPTICIWRGG